MLDGQPHPRHGRADTGLDRLRDRAPRAGAGRRGRSLTGFGRTKRMTERAAGQLPRAAEVLELDVNSPEDLERVRAELDARWGGLDGRAARGRLRPAGRARRRLPRHAGAERGDRVPDERVLAEGARGGGCCRCSRRAPGGAGVVGLDFDAGVAWPSYDWMGVAKAALEAVARYLARELGPARRPREPRLGGSDRDARRRRHPRLLASSPTLWSADARRSAWDSADAGPVADAACFLLSPLARGITARDPARRRRLSTRWAAPRPPLRPLPRRHERRDPADRRDRLPRDGALARLIERGDEQIVVLVRAATTTRRARAAGTTVLARLYDEPPAGRGAGAGGARGRAAAAGSGCRASDRERLIGSVDRIVHCAASISFELPLAARRARSTSGGVARVLELGREIAAGGRLRRLVHVSTAYVSGRHAGDFGEQDLDVGQEFRNTYERSKNEAEQLLRRSRGPAARDRAAEHRRRAPRERLDVRVQRDLLADAGVRTGTARRGARAAGLDRRLRAGRLRRPTAILALLDDDEAQRHLQPGGGRAGAERARAGRAALVG